MTFRSWAALPGATLLVLSPYLAFSQVATSPPTGPLTLAQAWAQATEYNKEIQQQRKQVDLSAELVKDRQNERLPRVVTRGTYAYLGGLLAYEPHAGLQNPEAVAVPPSPHAY